MRSVRVYLLGFFDGREFVAVQNYLSRAAARSTGEAMATEYANLALSDSGPWYLSWELYAGRERELEVLFRDHWNTVICVLDVILFSKET